VPWGKGWGTEVPKPVRRKHRAEEKKRFPGGKAAWGGIEERRNGNSRKEGPRAGKVKENTPRKNQTGRADFGLKERLGKKGGNEMVLRKRRYPQDTEIKRKNRFLRN